MRTRCGIMLSFARRKSRGKGFWKTARYIEQVGWLRGQMQWLHLNEETWPVGIAIRRQSARFETRWGTIRENVVQSRRKHNCKHQYIARNGNAGRVAVRNAGAKIPSSRQLTEKSCMYMAICLRCIFWGKLDQPSGESRYDTELLYYMKTKRHAGLVRDNMPFLSYRVNAQNKKSLKIITFLRLL